MAKLTIEFAPTVTGKVLGDFAWDFCSTISAAGAVSTASSTLTELGNGVYILANPNVAEDSAFRLHLTSDATIYATGIFSLSDGDMALQSSLASVPTNPLLTTDSRLDHLDVDISSRLAPDDTLATVTNLTNAPGAGDFTATMKTSLNSATPAVTVSDKTGFSLVIAPPTAAAIRAEIDANSTKLDATVSSRLSDEAYTAPDNSDIATILSAIQNATYGLDALLTAINGISTGSGTSAEEVWEYSDRSLTDKAGFSGEATNMVSEPDNASVGSILTAIQDATYGLNALLTAVNSRLAESGYTAPDNTGISEIKAQTDLMQFTGGKIEADATVSIDQNGIDEIAAAVLAGADPLNAAVPGSYAAGTAGYNLGKLTIPLNPTAPIVPIPVNIDPDTQTVFFPDTQAGRVVKATPTHGQIIDSVLVDKQRTEVVTVTGSPGSYLALIRGIEYSVVIDGWGDLTFTVTDDSERQFADYVQEL